MNLELGCDKESRHSYISDFYKGELARFGRDASLLEIGVYRGGSMKLWRERFDNVWGVDSRDRREFFDFNFILADAYSQETADSLPDFDIIIDDGSHQIHDQMAVVDLYLPKVKPGGMLIIEDVTPEVLMFLRGFELVTTNKGSMLIIFRK